MHYQNGREAKVGDPVVTRDYQGRTYAGMLIEANPGSTTCNGTMLCYGNGSGPASIRENVTIGEMAHAEDLFAALDEKVAAAKAAAGVAGGPPPVPGQS